MSHRPCRNPPRLLYLLTRGPWPWSKRESGFDQSVPVTAITGGEGGRVEKHNHVSAHLWVAGIGSGQAVAVAQQRQCGRRWGRMAGRVLRWSGGAGK
jgi:hypothetical protein